MALETATYINQLVSTNPLGSDPIASGDDHIRLIKSALKATFPAITGPVTVDQDTINNPFPTGGIIMWSGSIASIPSGWALCDGTNGTPNLRDRFVVGAGTSYAVGDTGGAASVTLDSTQIPSHTHTITATASSDSQGAHTHTINDPGHIHRSFGSGAFNGGGDGGAYGQNGTGYGARDLQSNTTGITINSAGAHTHNITVSATASSTGGGLAHENRPPYYALAYIMKV